MPKITRNKHKISLYYELRANLMSAYSSSYSEINTDFLKVENEPSGKHLQELESQDLK